MTNFEYYKNEDKLRKAYGDFLDYKCKTEHNPLNIPDVFEWLYMKHNENEPKFKKGDVIMQKGDDGYTYNVLGYDQMSRSYQCFKLGDMGQYLWEYCQGGVTISIYNIPIDMDDRFKKIGYINLTGEEGE